MSDISLSKAVRANLLSLQNTAEMMNKTQSRLATGNKVNSALDNPSNFFTASALNSRAADMSNLLDSMASGIKVIEAANNGITALTKNLESMQSTLRQARQDKSFQTQSFEVSDNTKIKLGGGQYGDSVSEISLAAATQAGTKAQITTSGTSAFLGPRSSADGTAGAGARSVISMTPGAFAAGDSFKVANVDVVVADTNADTIIDAEDVVANIQEALDDSDVAGKYKVTLGTGDNDGKIIIETVDTSAAAASVNLDPDNNATTGANVATKGSTTFNYSAVSTTIEAGGEQIQTGASFDEFVTNLQAKAAEGGYTVSADATTKQITLTNTQWGGAPPAITGVASYSAAEPASKAVTTFELQTSGTAGTNARTTFDLANAGASLTHTQNLTIAGATGPVTITAGMDISQVKSALEADANILANYTVDVDANFGVTLTANATGTTAPAVSSDQVAVTVQPATISPGGTMNFSGDTDLSAYVGSTITLDDGAGNTVSYTFTNANTGQVATALGTAVGGLNETGKGFTVANNGSTGLTFARADGKDFTISITGGASTALGVTSTTTTSNGTMAETAGITAAPVLADGTAPGTQSLQNNQTLTIAGATGGINLTAGMTASQVQGAIEADTNIGDNYDVAVDADFGVTLTAKTAGLSTAPTVTSSQIAAGATAASLTGAGGTNLTGDPNLSALIGSSVTLTSPSGRTATYSFTSATTGQAGALETALEVDGYTINRTATGLAISRADGENFTLTTTGGVGSTIGLNGSLTSNNGVMATADGIVGGNATGVTRVAGEDEVPEVNGVVDAPADLGASVETVAAEKNEFTVSYDGKTANVSIGGVKGGVGTATNALDVKNWQDATVAAVNTQLKNQGIVGVEVKFDDAGKMQFVAKTAEAKTLAVSGADATDLFGSNGVNTGVAEKSELNSTKTVDKFVELINRDHGGRVRASNDNGKLRIENLSTQALEIGIDTGGAISALKVDGNSVRANLSKQFNELRDQLDKLSDDASFNGINLLRGDKLKITFNESGTSSIDIQAKDKDGNIRGINASNLNVDSLVAEDLDTDEKIDAFLGKLSSALTELRSQASAFGSNLSSVENRQSFTKNMINTLETGAANLTLADTNEEAANLLALQTRQQLSSSALSMASQQDQAVLQLLR